MKLSQNNLKVLPLSIPKPLYDRNGHKQFIVHIGVGGFHRSHQAVYLDKLLNLGLANWAICGMGIKSEDEKMYKALRAQDYLYTLIVKHPDGSIEPRIIGSMVDYIFVPENRSAAIEKMADPQTKIVSLTITEGGYNFDQNGNFILDNPDIQWDIEHPNAPKTVFGLLIAALRMRKERNIPAFTVLSCDNMLHNGDMTRKMLLSFTHAVDHDLLKWIMTHVSFPNSMVDRITPVTTLSDIELLYEKYGIEDAWPVTCEPFTQWALEDHFPNSRPALEQSGVQFVNDIELYEKVKIRLLNAGHSFLGFIGSLSGYNTIDETIGDQLIQQSLRAFMDEEVTPALGAVEGIDLAAYKDSLFQRFSNPNIRDQLVRICSDSSAKLPKFLIPTIQEQLQHDGQIKYGVMVLAAWCHALELYAKGQYGYPIQDAMIDELVQATSRSTENGVPEFLKTAIIFGALSKQSRFTNEFMKRLNDIRTVGIKEALIA